MARDISWDEYNAHQWGRAVRPSLERALAAVGPADGGARVAVDVGCGEGVEVLALLDRGWTVHAVDGATDPLRRLADRAGDALDRLRLHPTSFEDLAVLPKASLVHSSYALPFCPPEHFGRVWSAVRGALRPGAVLACQLFGPHDDAFGDPGMTFHTVDEARELLDGLEVVEWREEDADGTAWSGPKHWHVFHVVARRPAAVSCAGG